MANKTLHLPQKIREYSFKLLKSKSDEFLKDEFAAPDKKQMSDWLKKKLSAEYRPHVKDIVHSFRKSMPILSNRVSDGKKSTKGKKGLGRTFAAPSWASADLGDLVHLFIAINVAFKIITRFLSTTWKKLWRLFHCCAINDWAKFHQKNKKQKMGFD